MKILASADLHLGKQSAGMDDTLDESSAVYTWYRMVDWAVENQVDVVVLAGDVVDYDNRFFEAIGPVQKGFEALGGADIQVVLTAGNHDFDVLPDIIKNREYEHVHLLGNGGKWEMKTVQAKTGKIQFVGWSFPQRHYSDDPFAQFPELKYDADLPLIGVVHGDFYDAKSQYAPLSMQLLSQTPATTWIVGHLHKPDKLNDRKPLVFYPGSPQALSAKETGKHGPVLLTIQEDDITHEPLLFSPVRYDEIRIDVTEADNESEFRNLITRSVHQELEEKAAELSRVSFMIVDIMLTGRHRSLSNLDKWSDLVVNLEQEMIHDTMVSVRSVKNNVQPAVDNLEELAKQPTPPGILAKTILEIKAGESSDLLANLLNQQQNALSRINGTNTYRPLVNRNLHVERSEDTARTYLLHQCYQLLDELLSQHEEVQE